MEPLFTKTDLLTRREIQQSLEKVTGKHTATMNITLKELNYCIDQRLSEIEKYLNIEKEQNGEYMAQSRNRRGATMSGSLEFGTFDSLDFGDRTTKDTFEGFSPKGGIGFIENDRTTLEHKLSMFRVTNSDEEDSNYFDESDHELEIEKGLESAKKKSSLKENIFRDSSSPRANYTPRASLNGEKRVSLTTLSPFDDDDNGGNRVIKTMNLLPIQRKNDEKFKLKVNESTSIELLSNNRKTSIDKTIPLENKEIRKNSNSTILGSKKSKVRGNYLESIDVELPVEISITEITEETDENLEEEMRDIVEIDDDEDDYELRRTSPVQINFNFEDDNENLMLESNFRMTEPIYLEKSREELPNDRRSRVFNIFEDCDEIDSLVKELKKKEEDMLKSKKQGIKQSKRKSMRISNLWKKVLTSVAQQEHLQIDLKKISKMEKQGSKDLNTENNTDFEICAEDIERLTASDPAEYFKSNTTLLSKISVVTIDQFEYVHTLGAGAYGKVFLVRKKASGDYFAMKVIGSDNELSRNYIKNLLNEREVFSVIKSSFCVNALATFTYENLVCFVMEYLPGRDLYEELFERETFCLDSFSVKFYLAEIILGIEDLHDNGVIHRDIKPANVLIDEEGHLKLTDFGLSEFTTKIGTEKNDGNYIKGSANYIAPEVIEGGEVSFEVDWWALGIMAYLMVETKFPFDGESIEEVFENIKKGEIDWSNVGNLIFF